MRCPCASRFLSQCRLAMWHHISLCQLSHWYVCVVQMMRVRFRVFFLFFVFLFMKSFRGREWRVSLFQNKLRNKTSFDEASKPSFSRRLFRVASLFVCVKLCEPHQFYFTMNSSRHFTHSNPFPLRTVIEMLLSRILIN